MHRMIRKNIIQKGVRHSRHSEDIRVVKATSDHIEFL